jgi:hypothetical protein
VPGRSEAPVVAAHGSDAASRAAGAGATTREEEASQVRDHDETDGLGGQSGMGSAVGRREWGRVSLRPFSLGTGYQSRWPLLLPRCHCLYRKILPEQHIGQLLPLLWRQCGGLDWRRRI